MSDTEMKIWSLAVYIMIASYGLLIGSFLNVVIYRVPKEESITKVRSHCMSCGYKLAWFDLIPVFSWLALKGKCRKCGSKISVQYPIIEATNALLWVAIFYSFNGLSHFIDNGVNWNFILYITLASCLLALSVIDFRTFIIPPAFNLIIFVLGIVNVSVELVKYLVNNDNGKVFSDLDIFSNVIGIFAVSVPLLVISVISSGRAIGGGDIKLMAATGFLIGWKKIVLAFFVGCLVGSIIHIARMKISKAEHVLAMGPYLSVGIMVAVLWGEPLIDWYLGFFKK